MKLNLINKLGDGGFADVWHATDDLDRHVAVKIIRPASVGIADALAHGKALARASHHPNVVSVIAMEKVADPDSGDQVDCVVMELISGKTLEETLKSGALLSHAEVEAIGLGILQGLSHIHAQGLAHGDLHQENVMIAEGVAKVIDILYLNSLAVLSTEKRSAKLRRDLLSLRIILQQLIIQSEIDSAEATEFNNLLESGATIQDIEHAFRQIISLGNSGNDERAIDHAFARLVEENFVEGEEYAAALAEETPDSVILPVLKRLVASNAYERRHQYYVKILWNRLPSGGRTEILQGLGTSLDTQLPKGKWSPGIRLLKILGVDGWNGLSTRIRIKVESLIVKDILAGRKDIYSAKAVSGGALGTYAFSFWRHFTNPDILADNLISLLRQNWYTQNYVGEYFFQRIPAIARKTGKRSEFIQAIKIAVANDARLVVDNIDGLPDDWVEDILPEEL